MKLQRRDAGRQQWTVSAETFPPLLLTQGLDGPAHNAVNLHLMQDLHEGWGERLTDEMTARNLTNAALALECGVHETTIIRIRQGRLCPNDELKWKIAGALGIRMDRLWEWPKVVPPKPSGVAA